MSGIPYLPRDISFDEEEDSRILAAIKSRRPSGLSAFDRVLLHAPKIAGPWLELASAVRFKTSISSSIRETAIARAYSINRVEEEWNIHSANLLKSPDNSITAQFVDFVKNCPTGQVLSRYKAAGLCEKYAAVLALTDASTLQIQVPAEVLELAKEFFSSQELVELLAAIALHNAVARVFGAFDIKL
ncbi:unnamed protein product [Clonostachys byssicola]|uniref:Carboxymuconolactone decarboxylase-like domain-containing protein n=1 Tax=Clonostachys byssicola TaxID=160290 RepID=A0A9N9US57_9HYPO|nr:unnamed protein product [Clonostachys byssicola]